MPANKSLPLDPASSPREMAHAANSALDNLWRNLGDIERLIEKRIVGLKKMLTALLDGSGTVNYLSLWTGAKTLGDSVVQQSATGGRIGVDGTPHATAKVRVPDDDGIILGATDNFQIWIETGGGEGQ